MRSHNRIFKCWTCSSAAELEICAHDADTDVDVATKRCGLQLLVQARWTELKRLRGAEDKCSGYRVIDHAGGLR